MTRVMIALAALLLAAAPMAASAVTPGVGAGVGAQAGEQAFQRGLDAIRAHNYDEAVADFTDAIRARVNLADSYYNRGLAYFALDHFSPAIDDFRASIAIRDDYDARVFLGSALDNVGQYDPAIEQYRAAIRLRPDAFHAWFEIGVA